MNESEVDVLSSNLHGKMVNQVLPYNVVLSKRSLTEIFS